MESTLRLHYGAPSTMPLHIPSTMTTARATKFNFSSSHCSHLLSISPTRHPLGHVFSPVIRAIDRSSMPSISDKADNKSAIGSMGVSLVLACALCLTGCSGMMTPKAIATEQHCTMDCQTKLMPYMGGKLKPFLDMSASLVSSKGEHRMFNKSISLNWPNGQEPSIADVNTFKMKVLQQTGNADKAFKVLEKEYVKMKDYEKKEYGQSQSTYTLEMALVEVLICQGKYKDALEYNCLKTPKGSAPTDYRVPLYKAIIYTMLNDEKEASKYWKNFGKLLDFPPW